MSISLPEEPTPPDTEVIPGTGPTPPEFEVLPPEETNPNPPAPDDPDEPE